MFNLVESQKSDRAFGRVRHLFVVVLTIALIAGLSSIPSPSMAADAPVTNGKIVVIDAGHQRKANLQNEPIGPGSSTHKPKVSGGTCGVVTRIPEYKITLQVAKKLRVALDAEGYTVYMVRTKHDVNIPNSKRAKFANKKKANLFIRLHCDAVDSNTRGFLTLTPARNNWTKKIYKKSLSASETIHKAVLKATKAQNRGIARRGDLTGFNYAKVPSVLFEMGVMTNTKDDKLLSQKSYQKKLVRGMVKGINIYFDITSHFP